MGICAQTPKENTVDMSNIDITSPEFAPDVRSPLKLEETTHRQNFKFVHSKHYERYFNRRFKVSMCCAKGERKTMEDAHLCKFDLSNHPGYAVFGVFDGHNGSKASGYLSQHLYNRLNNIADIEDSQHIIDVINKMDKEFVASKYGQCGSTVLLAIIGADFDSDLNIDPNNTDREKNVENVLYQASIEIDKTHKESFGDNRWLAGFAIIITLCIQYIIYHFRTYCWVFWCGDSRGFLIKDFDINSTIIPKFEVLTSDHNTDNSAEIKRIKNEGGNIINGRVDGKLGVTRSFGDSVMKYDGSVITSQCEYSQFSVDIGDALLLCCDGLTEKWNDKTLISKLQMNLNGRSKDKTDTDTATGVGDLVDDAIYEGSDDNISAMFIQFKDGTKQVTHKNYKDVGTINVN
eukprot:113329_1